MQLDQLKRGEFITMLGGAGGAPTWSPSNEAPRGQ
jgi:hypothetical protein